MSANPELALRFALKSHPGRVRPLNEDAVGADPTIGLFLLADGLGGYNAGEVAATMAVSSVLSFLGARLQEANRSDDAQFDPALAMRDALIALNDEIFRAALNSTVYEGMATTAVVAWFLGGRLWVAHAGDSRLYRFRGGQLHQITRDHSFSQELLDAGMISEDEARALPAKNLVTRAVGASPALEPEVHDYDLLPGDIVMMCSDGLSEMVAHDAMRAAVARYTQDIAQSARVLIDSAIEAGGRDNASVILVRVDAQAPAAASGDASDAAPAAGTGSTLPAAAVADPAGGPPAEASPGEDAPGPADPPA